MKLKTVLVAAGAWLLVIGSLANAAETIPLAGTWRFQLDRDDAGEREAWFARALPERVKLPGGLAEQGIGDPPSLETKWIGGTQRPEWFKDPRLARYATPENFKFPYWLTPDRHYVGAAWFQRDVEIPAAWAGRRVLLVLERAHWETRVWIDGKSFGSNNALGTPHEYDLGQLAPGQHVCTIRVDNRLIVDVGINSHSVSDHTQGNWNGIVGAIELRATPALRIDYVQAYPDFNARKIRLRAKVANAAGGTVPARLRLTVSGGAGSRPIAQTELPVQSSGAGSSYETELVCAGPIAPWDEFSPRLYTVKAELERSDTGERHEVTTTCGFRDLRVEGTTFVINGRQTFFRGTLECAIFPKTGHPPTDVPSWERIIRVAKEHGLNMLRFHSWCPPEAAFAAADRLGMYLQVEASSWPNQSTTLGDGKPIDEWIYAESYRILTYYGNHPSFVLMLHGNEPGGKNRDAFLARWVTRFRELDPRRLYSSGAGWPQIAENEFHVLPQPRIQASSAGLKSRINGKPPETTTDYRDFIRARRVPVISHEIGQWCVYPNFDEIPKYTGYLKARNFEIFRDHLVAHHMGDQARAFLHASGKLQTLCYKEDIESALRTPGMGGFQLLDLHDFPGQGTALVGALDPFWEGKGYVTPEEYRRFCNATVPLARLAKRVFTTDESLAATIEIAHFGAAPLERAVVEWKLVDAKGASVAGGHFPEVTIPIGRVDAAMKADLSKLPAPARYRLVAGIRGTAFENHWDVWLYPKNLDSAIPAGVTVASELDDATLAALRRGGRVLLLIAPERVRNAEQEPVHLGFSSIFWNTAWWQKRPAPTTLGILCDPRHSALAAFPTESHSNWQWWYAIHRAGAMILDDLPPALRPTVQVIDDWVTARRLGLVFEARVGGGRLVVCSIDLERDLEADPVRRQLRHSLLRYLRSDAFRPRVEVSPEQIRALMTTPRPAGAP